MNYRISFTPTAEGMLKAITNPHKSTIVRRIEGLKTDPEKQGKPLTASLRGYRSLQIARRYRVVYQVKRTEVIVMVLAVGMRKEGDKTDIYALVRKLLDLV